MGVDISVDLDVDIGDEIAEIKAALRSINDDVDLDMDDITVNDETGDGGDGVGGDGGDGGRDTTKFLGEQCCDRGVTLQTPTVYSDTPSRCFVFTSIEVSPRSLALPASLASELPTVSVVVDRTRAHEVVRLNASVTPMASDCRLSHPVKRLSSVSDRGLVIQAVSVRWLHKATDQLDTREYDLIGVRSQADSMDTHRALSTPNVC